MQDLVNELKRKYHAQVKPAIPAPTTMFSNFSAISHFQRYFYCDMTKNQTGLSPLMPFFESAQQSYSLLGRSPK